MSLKHNKGTIEMQKTPGAEYIYDKNVKNYDDVKLHQEAVKQLMNVIAHEIKCRATYHDYTKFKHEDLTFEEHMKLERHHLNNKRGVHVDVNVVDLVEFICDCVSSAAQRSDGLNFNLLKVDESLLQAIINNTAFDLWKIVRVKR